eukprot:GHVS01011488.1.p1 GENE.GHVS01011488.1~~GHVS01011488.1.p1  ORF type:complete len:204 (-),score=41.64 GHVS01011488.1:621-1232(-)
MYWFTAPSFSVIPLICPLTFICSCVYPFYRSLCLLYHPYNPVTTITRVQEHPAAAPMPNFATEYIHWLMYWMLFSCFSMFEHFSMSIISFIPLYMELKFICFLWLGSEEFQGAGWLWVAVVEKHCKKLDECMFKFYHKHAPASLKALLEETTRGSTTAIAAGGGATGGGKDKTKNNKVAGGGGGFDKSRDEGTSVGLEGLKNK